MRTKFLPRKLARLFGAAVDHFHSARADNYPSSAARLEQIKIFSTVQRIATEDSARYIYENVSDAMIFSDRQALWDFVLSRKMIDGLIAEFGVSEGASINYFAARMKDRTIYGFDSFDGLKEAWSGTPLKAGHFSRGGGPPSVESNVKLVAGWFDETVPIFIQQRNQDFALIHVDCDTYQSAKIVLELLSARIVAGTVIIFDEYLNYPGWRHGERKAWGQFVETRKIRYRYIAFSQTQAAVEILVD